MADDRSLLVKLGFDDSAMTRGISRMATGLQGAGSAAVKMGAMAAKAIAAVGAAAAAVGGASAKVGAEFEYSMTRVAANAGATTSQFNALNEKARELGATTAFSAAEAADAMYKLSSAGMDSDQILGSVAATMNLAGAEGIDLASAASLITNSLGQFSLKAEESDRVANLFAKTVQSSNQEAADLGEAMKYAGSQAGLLGVSIEETAAATAIFADVGIKGSMAGTDLASAMRVISTDKKLAPYLRGASIETHGLAGVLDEMTRNGLTAAEAQKMLGRQGRGVAVLLKAGSAELQNMTENLTGSTAAADKYSAMMDTVQGDMASMKSAAEEVGLSLFDTFKPQLREAIQMATDKIREIGEWIVENRKTIEEWVQKGWNLMQSAFEWIGDRKEAIISIFKGITKVIGGVMTVLGPVLDGIGVVIDTVGDLVQDVQNAFSSSMPETETGMVSLIMAVTQAGKETLPVLQKMGADQAQAIADSYRQAAVAAEKIEEEGQRNAAIRKATHLADLYQGLADMRREKEVEVAEAAAEAAANAAEDRAAEAAQREKETQQALHASRLETIQLQSEELFAKGLEVDMSEYQRVDTSQADLAALRESYYNLQLMQYEAFGDRFGRITQSIGMQVLNGEKSFGKMWGKIRQMMLSDAISQFAAYAGKRVTQFLAQKATEVYIEAQGEAGKTAAAATGAAARSVINKKEIAEDAAATGFSVARIGAKVGAFYAGLGPFGVPLAAATIAAFVALISKKFHSGGPVTGSADEVPAILQTGENVWSRQDVANAGGMASVEQMKSGGGGTTINLQVDARTEYAVSAITRFFEADEGRDFFRRLLEDEAILSGA